MNIKSLLLGSAAAMVAVSGAQAADAVVVEPEPVEYVRVCDAYGSGFFYIPGTETCLRFNGYIRSYYSVAHVEDDAGLEENHTDWATRARLGIDTRNETDWGTLRGFMRFDTDLRGGAGGAVMDRAMISLAGFRAGVGANYWTTNHGFAGVNLAGIVATGGTFGFATVDDGWYQGSDSESTLFDYTWAGDGLSITGGVEAVGGINRNINNSGPQTNYYAGFNYSADWGGVAFTYAYDSDAVDNAGSVGGDAWKVSVDLDLSEFVPGGLLHAMYMDDGEYNTNYLNAGIIADPESIWQVSFQMDLSDEFVLAAQYTSAEADATDPAAGVDEGDAWIASVGLNWFPAAAPGFTMYASYAWGEADVYDSTSAGAFAGSTGVEFDQATILVRRNF